MNRSVALSERLTAVAGGGGAVGWSANSPAGKRVSEFGEFLRLGVLGGSEVCADLGCKPSRERRARWGLGQQAGQPEGEGHRRLGSSPLIRRSFPQAPERPAPGDSPPALSRALLPTPPALRGRSPSPHPRIPTPVFHLTPPLISGRSLSGDFHPGVGGAAGQRSGDGGRGAPPRARVRPRPGRPVTQPRRLSRNQARGAAGAFRVRSGLESTAPLWGGRGRYKAPSRPGGAPPPRDRKRPSPSADPAASRGWFT